MARFDPSKYAQVEDRIPLFWAAHPNGRISTELLRCSDDYHTVIVRVALVREDGTLVASGMAEEHQGGNGPNKDCWLENCETSAIGRALANAGWHGSIGEDKAPRPSREEMEKIREPNPDAGKVVDWVNSKPDPQKVEKWLLNKLRALDLQCLNADEIMHAESIIREAEKKKEETA